MGPGLAQFTPLPASRFAWHGDTKVLAVDLPIDGVSDRGGLAHVG